MKNFELFDKIRSEWDSFFEKPENSDVYFNQIREIMKTKIDFELALYRDRYIKGRIYHRIRAKNINSVKEYVEFLKQNPQELQNLKALLTIHTTEFFRDINPFRYLESTILPRLARSAYAAGNKLKILSAPCSTGQEVYSVAIIVHQLVKSGVIKCPVEIIGVDIDKPSIEKARVGIYRADEMKNISEQIMRDYFIKVDTNYKIRDEVKQFCQFEVHDLFKPLPYDSKFDLILCRNFLIYISYEDQMQIIENLNTHLKKGGYIMLGITEGFKLMNELEYEIDNIDERIYKYKGKGKSSNLVDYFDNRAEPDVIQDSSRVVYVSPDPIQKRSAVPKGNLPAATKRLEAATNRLSEKFNQSEQNISTKDTSIEATMQTPPSQSSVSPPQPSVTPSKSTPSSIINSNSNIQNGIESRSEAPRDVKPKQEEPQNKIPILSEEEMKEQVELLVSQQKNISKGGIKVRMSNSFSDSETEKVERKPVEPSEINKKSRKISGKSQDLSANKEEDKENHLKYELAPVNPKEKAQPKKSKPKTEGQLLLEKIEEIKNEKYREIQKIIAQIKKEEDSNNTEKEMEELGVSVPKKKKGTRVKKSAEIKIEKEEPELPLSPEEVRARDLSMDYILKKQDEEREYLQKLIEMAKKNKSS